jgi:hypothetical protein
MAASSASGQNSASSTKTDQVGTGYSRQERHTTDEKLCVVKILYKHDIYPWSGLPHEAKSGLCADKQGRHQELQFTYEAYRDDYVKWFRNWKSDSRASSGQWTASFIYQHMTQS